MAVYNYIRKVLTVCQTIRVHAGSIWILLYLDGAKYKSYVFNRNRTTNKCLVFLWITPQIHRPLLPYEGQLFTLWLPSDYKVDSCFCFWCLIRWTHSWDITRWNLARLTTGRWRIHTAVGFVEIPKICAMLDASCLKTSWQNLTNTSPDWYRSNISALGRHCFWSYVFHSIQVISAKITTSSQR